MSGQAKHSANISLGIMGLGFAATLPFQGTVWGAFLQGGFEAGLVGGMADWFAVTALFRHPLGIPIPHTALLPKNREKLTNSLVDVVENDLLNKESITTKLAQLQIVSKTFNIVESQLHTEQAKQALSAFGVQVLQNIDVEQFIPLLEKELKGYLYALDVKMLMPAAIEQCISRGYDEQLIDFLLDKAAHWAGNAESRYRLGSIAMSAIQNFEVEGFMQFAMKSIKNMLSEDKLGGIIQSLLMNGIADLQQPGSRNRSELRAALRKELEGAAENSHLIDNLNTWKDELVHGLQLEGQLRAVIAQMLIKAEVMVISPDFADRYALPFISGLLGKLKDNSDLMARMEQWLQQQIGTLIEKNHSAIGRVVRDNIDKLETETLIYMIEEKVGKDIQWIRVNGAICGFLIGIVLETLKHIF